ncbi:MAG TPA: hypothetical protein VFG20_11860 [Planctomycetaceae bacterium]|nr:hypothetical protein [Planctomycetaceae bacterium]
MTFLGKVLVVVHLVLSVMFMAFAGAVYTAQTNWRKQSEADKKALQTAQSSSQAEQDRLKAQVEDLTKERDGLNNDKQALTGQVTTLTAENTRLDNDNKGLKTTADTQRTIAELASQEAEERLKEAQVQRARNVELNKSRDEAVSALAGERDKIFGLELQMNQARTKYDQLLKDNATMRAYLAANSLPTDVRRMTVSVSPPPDLDGEILEARKETKGNRLFVELSVGSDDGLIVGHTMTAYRGDKFLGRVRLEDVRPDKSVGVVIETAPNSVIQKDDHVTTRF